MPHQEIMNAVAIKRAQKRLALKLSTCKALRVREYAIK